MKKTLTLLVLIALCRISLFSQYVLVPVSPPPMFTFNDLWHFTIQGAATDSSSVFYVSMRIYDGNSLLKLKSNTSLFTLNGSLSYYNASNISQLQPFTTSYYDGGMLQGVVASGGQFPAGTYNIVFTLFGKFADGEFVPLYEDASQAVVEAMWPPMLLSPPDGDTIDTQYPLLTWTPAFASFYNGLITYTLNMVEILPGQNAYQAIQSNPYYFTQNNIPVTMLNYPPSAQLLDTSKSYAWQVYADGNGSPMGSSEVWQFTFGKQEDGLQKKKSTHYAVLKRVSDASIFLAKDDLLRFTYTDDYVLSASEDVRFFIYDEMRVVKYDFQNCNNCEVVKSEKYYTIKIGGQSGGIQLQRDKVYYLEIINDKNEKRVLKFSRL